MQSETSYKIWKRTSPTPGLPRIYVLCDDEGIARQGRTNSHAQCATLDRIPFMMKAKDLIARYAPERTQP